MSDTNGFTTSHVGLCVTDLERSVRFYRDGLGFTVEEKHTIGNEFADALEVERDVVLESQFIRREGIAIELLYYKSPATHGTPSTSRSQLGLTHLSFYVTDLDAAVDRLVAAGGTLLDTTRTKQPGIELLFVADPDGTRIELMQAG